MKTSRGITYFPVGVTSDRRPYVKVINWKLIAIIISVLLIATAVTLGVLLGNSEARTVTPTTTVSSDEVFEVLDSRRLSPPVNISVCGCACQCTTELLPLGCQYLQTNLNAGGIFTWHLCQNPELEWANLCSTAEPKINHIISSSSLWPEGVKLSVCMGEFQNHGPNLKFDEYTTTSNIPKSSWMHAHRHVLYPKSVFAVTFPGSHDSGSFDVDGSTLVDVPKNVGVTVPGFGLLSYATLISMAKNVLPAEVKLTIHNWAQTQDVSIYEQLQAGARFLDLRVCYYVDPTTNQGNIYFHHYFVVGSLFEPALDQISKFVSEQAGEVLILEFAEFTGFGAAQYTQLKNLLHEKLHGFMYNSSSVLDYNTTMGDLVSSGQRIIVVERSNNYLDGLHGTIETTWADKPTPAGLINYNNHVMNQWNGNGWKRNNGFLALAWILTADREILMNSFFKPCPKPSTLLELGDLANAVLSNWAHGWTQKKIKPQIFPNIVMIDHFQATTLVDIIIQDLNVQNSSVDELVGISTPVPIIMNYCRCQCAGTLCSHLLQEQDKDILWWKAIGITPAEACSTAQSTANEVLSHRFFTTLSGCTPHVESELMLAKDLQASEQQTITRCGGGTEEGVNPALCSGDSICTSVGRGRPVSCNDCPLGNYTDGGTACTPQLMGKNVCSCRATPAPTSCAGNPQFTNNCSNAPTSTAYCQTSVMGITTTVLCNSCTNEPLGIGTTRCTWENKCKCIEAPGAYDYDTPTQHCCDYDNGNRCYAQSEAACTSIGGTGAGIPWCGQTGLCPSR